MVIFSCFLPPTNTHVSPLWPIVQCRFIFRHLVTMSGAWGMRSVGQQLMNSIHTGIHKLYAPIVTYSFILWEHVRSSEGRGRSHGVNAQANWEDNVLLEWRAVDSRGFTSFLKINWHQQHVGASAESRKSSFPVNVFVIYWKYAYTFYRIQFQHQSPRKRRMWICPYLAISAASGQECQ